MSEPESKFVVGQRVARVSDNHHWRYGRVDGFEEVARVLKRYLVTDQGNKYQFDGKPYPHSYRPSHHIEPATEAHNVKIRAERARDQLKSISWADVPDEFALALVRGDVGELVASEIIRQKDAKR